MHLSESIAVAFDAVRSQKLRSGLTLLSVAIGVFGIIFSTSVTSMLQEGVTGQLADLGENSFLIQRTPSIQFGNSWRKYLRRKNISYQQAKDFKERMTLTNMIAISNTAPGYTIKAGLESTDPDVSLIGVDDMYFVVNPVDISDGRIFNVQDVALSQNSAIIGNDIVVKLFPDGRAVGRTITIKNQSFTVVGVLKTKGGMLGQSQDNRVLIPISVFVKYYTWEWDASVDISVKAYDKEALPATVDEAIGLMRVLRSVKPHEENNFELDTNEAMSAQFAGFSTAILAVAWISGLGALFAAGIGIMNMMLVSVKERTREIGVRKALGARRKWIVRQFLVEAVVLCQFGGIAGVVGGIGCAWLLTVLFSIAGMEGMPFSMPWGATIFSVVACTVIGITFGLYPAARAASLDPIEALRYE